MEQQYDSGNTVADPAAGLARGRFLRLRFALAPVGEVEGEQVRSERPGSLAC